LTASPDARHPRGGAELPSIPAPELEAFAAAVLNAIGLRRGAAAVTAHCLVLANLRGVDSHGVLRLIQYADTVANGEVNPRPRTRVLSKRGVFGLVDAGGGYGFVPTIRAMDLALELAKSNGMGFVGVRNSHHFGMAAVYAERAALAGRIGIVTTNTGPVMAPAGVLRPLVGNNPIAIAIPRKPPASPIVLDMALSQTAFGRIRLAAAEGRDIPLGWAYDSRGEPTTDSREALRASLLSPVGGYKGYGLAVMIDILAGILTGAKFGPGADAHSHRQGGVGHLALALEPSVFIGRAQFDESVDVLERELKSAPVARQGAEVLVPGELEGRTMRRRVVEGVPISPELAEQLNSLASRLQVPRFPEHGGNG
jgi:LDH2 family malate/lactate/ureidoglycolate dehydrogenase